MLNFKFETDKAPISILGSRWEERIEDARICYQNEQATALYGDFIGMLLRDLFNEIHRLSQFDDTYYGKMLMQSLLEDGRLSDRSGTLSGKRVKLFSLIQQQTPKSIQSTIIDVTKRFMDPLSGLPGRDLFYDFLDHELFRIVREKNEVHICFVDLDGFKQVNDKFGHKAGDAVITEVGRRLQRAIRKHEMASRFGGDEFVVMLSGANVDALHVAEKKLIPILNEAYLVEGHRIDFIGASIGIASAPVNTSDVDELVKYADNAMYMAKSSGKNQAIVFEKGIQGKKPPCRQSH